MNKYIDKESPTKLALADSCPFYGSPAPDTIPDKYFGFAHAVNELVADLKELHDFDISFHPEQVKALMEAFEKFDERLGITAAQKEVKGVRLTLSRYKNKED